MLTALSSLTVASACAVVMGAAVSTALAGGYIDIATTPTGTQHEVRYTSGPTVYLEGMKGDQWVGRYWSADGRINVSYEGWNDDAFQIEINNQMLSGGWKLASESEAPRTQRGARHYVVELVNTQVPVRVRVHTLLDGTPVITRYLEITNTSGKPEALGKVYPWAGRLWPGGSFTLGYFTRSDWAHEGWFEWKQLPEGITVIKCDKGQSHDDPFFIVRNDAIGEYFIAHLAWSANWDMDFTVDQNGLAFKMGPAAAAAQRVIDPGETVTTPAVHMGHTSGDLDTAVQAMHQHLRGFVLPQRPADRSYLIEYLVPADQGFYTPFDEHSAMKCADVAAAIGAQVFILDAYWWDVTCDWYPSAKRFPHGLQPLIDYVHKKGMLFGLYVETEGGRGNVQDSKVAKEHPEWLGPKNIINLGNPQAAAWVESEICRLVDTYKLDLYRLDYNPEATGEGIINDRDGIQENNYWRYYEAFYSMYERIHKKYPNLILQQCAAGGARNDLGTVSRFHETYLTDGLSIPLEFKIYSGETLGLPPEIFVILHGADGRVGSGKPQNLDTILRMTYSMSTPQIFVGTVAPSVQDLSPERRARFLHYGKIFKEFIRPMLPTCKMYHHEPVSDHGGIDSSPWFAVEFSAPDRTKGWATIVRIGTTGNDTYIFRPRGLDPAKTYRVTFDSLDTTATVGGLRLMQEGLPIRLESVGSSELLLFQAQ